MPLDFERTVAATNAKGRGNQRMGHCPCHEDRTPSLSISEQSDGTCLAHCQAGCDKRAVFKSLRDRGCVRDDGARGNGTSPLGAGLIEGRYVRIHDYTDEAGQLGYQKCLKPDGTYVFRVPDGRGGWIEGRGCTDGVRRVLYRLPELLAGIAAGKGVVIVEGEKHADHLTREGFVATTFDGGAGALSGHTQPKDWPTLFRGVHVFMSGDNDAPGKAHACRVGRALLGVAKSVRVNKALPGVGPKGDVLNWWKPSQGNDAAAFRALMNATPLYVPEHGDDKEKSYKAEHAADLGSPAAFESADTDADEAEPNDDSGAPSVEAPALDDAAYHGAIGDAVRLIAPHTEAEPAGILLSLVVILGALVGHNPHVILDGARHGVNLFLVLVGATSDGRKGTGVERALTVVRRVDAAFARERVKTGLASGQGLVYHVRDAAELPEPTAGSESKKAREHDPGVADKRLCVIEPEFGKTLRLKRAEGNILSGDLRQSWDGAPLGTLTRRDPLRATDHHIAVVGMITPDELIANLERDDYSNGFLNRFAFAYVKRTRMLPDGGEPDGVALLNIANRIAQHVDHARTRGEVALTPAARALWAEEYPALTAGSLGRLAGITTRGAPIVRRVAMLYALLDGCDAVAPEHLRAALAVWRYSVDSVRFVFRDDDVTPDARRLLDALYTAGTVGLSRSQIRVDVFGSNDTPADRIRQSLDELQRAGMARCELQRTAGRPREIWRHIRHALALASSGAKGEKGAKGARSTEPDAEAPLSSLSSLFALTAEQEPEPERPELPAESPDRRLPDDPVEVVIS